MIFLPHRRKAFRSAVDPNTLLLCHFDGSNGSTVITDSAGRHTLTANGNAQISTAQAKFGQSLSVPGNGYISVPWNADFDVADKAFTVECFFRCSTVAALTYKALFSCRMTSGADFYGFGVMIIANVVYLFASTNGSSWNLLLGDTSTNDRMASVVLADTWYHMALVRNGNNWSAYLDGVEEWSKTVAGAVIAANNSFTIGNWTNYGGPFNGYIDELRFSNVARWTSNFTPPTAPY